MMPLCSVEKLIIQARLAPEENFSELSTSQRNLLIKIIKSYDNGELLDRFDKKAAKVDKMSEKLAGTRKRREGFWVSFTRFVQWLLCMRKSSDTVKEMAAHLIPNYGTINLEQGTTQELAQALTGNALKTDRELGQQFYNDWRRVSGDKLFIDNQSIPLDLPESPPDHWDVCIPDELKTLVDGNETMMHHIALFLTQGIMESASAWGETFKDPFLKEALTTFTFPEFFFEKTDLGVQLRIEAKGTQHITDTITEENFNLAHLSFTQIIHVSDPNAISTIDIVIQPA